MTTPKNKSPAIDEELPIKELVTELRELNKRLDMVTPYADIIATELEQIRSELSWLLDNRNDLPFLIKANQGETVAPSLCCYNCDAGMDLTLQQALDQGWTDLQRADGMTANYHGTCKACADAEAAADAKTAGRSEEPAAPRQPGKLF